jgi:hypothetical protein
VRLFGGRGVTGVRKGEEFGEDWENSRAGTERGGCEGGFGAGVEDSEEGVK